MYGDGCLLCVYLFLLIQVTKQNMKLKKKNKGNILLLSSHKCVGNIVTIICFTVLPRNTICLLHIVLFV